MKVSNQLLDALNRERFFIAGNQTTPAAGTFFLNGQTTQLPASVYPTGLAIIQGFHCRLAYDLIASPAQYQKTDGVVLLGNVNDSSANYSRFYNSTTSPAIYFFNDIYYHHLGLSIGAAPWNSLTIQVLFSPGTGIVAANVNNWQITYEIIIDFFTKDTVQQILLS